MKIVLSSVLICIVTSGLLAQSSSEKLKRDQDKLEKKIADTRLLLDKSKSKTSASLNDLRVIENQIKYREQLVRNFDNQIRSAELKVDRKEKQIAELGEKIETLKKQYKRLLLYAYKHRNKYGQMMYIFSADSYYEAVKRNKYLEKIQDIQQKQFTLIKQHQSLISAEISGIKDEKAKKLVMIDEKKKERSAIEDDKIKQEEIYQKFKQEEDQILVRLKKEQVERAELKRRVSEAIRNEIAAAESTRKKKESEAKKNEPEKNESTPSAGPAKEATASYEETKELELLSKNFEGNRGRLPWPVDKGTITEHFGKNAHPTLKNVFTNNRGIDISAPKNAQIRAVFEGEVTSVLSIPGAGKVVIIKHGNYRTVYSNLNETYVKTGQKVTTKKLIGSLLTTNNQNNSVAHFEIHQVVGTVVNCLNPSLWISQ